VIAIKYGSDPGSVRGATTEQLRERYLVDSLFHDGRLHLAYVSEDRTGVTTLEKGASWNTMPPHRRAYSFCWAMSGENLVYNDMDPVAIEELR
jgi:5-keto 4-deoxyuronate isomerase